MVAECPCCETELAVPSDSMLSEILVCNECQSELELISVDPIEVVLAPEIEEDWGE
jgi:alpha-aminoadipate/glutamate carrier protein LysW